MKAIVVVLSLLSAVTLAQEAQWSAGDTTFRLSDADGTNSLVGPDGTKLHAFGEREDVGSSIVSKSGSCLILLVRVTRPTEPGSNISGASDYGYLLRLTRTADSWSAKKLLERSSSSMMAPRRLVSELGAVADDGDTALLKVAVADAPQAPYKVGYFWQTWDLNKPKVLGEGLTMDNAAKQRSNPR